MGVDGVTVGMNSDRWRVGVGVWGVGIGSSHASHRGADDSRRDHAVVGRDVQDFKPQAEWEEGTKWCFGLAVVNVHRRYVEKLGAKHTSHTLHYKSTSEPRMMVE